MKRNRILYIIPVFLLAAVVMAQTTRTLVWDANTEPDLAGYNIYTCPGLPCDLSKDAQGALLTATLYATTVTNNYPAPTGSGFSFVTAFDASNNESGPSNVIFFEPPPPPPDTTPPAAPSNYRMVE